MSCVRFTLVVLTAVALGAAGMARALDCEGRLVSMGASPGDVQAICSDPAQVSDTIEIVLKPVYDPHGRRGHWHRGHWHREHWHRGFHRSGGVRVFISPGLVVPFGSSWGPYPDPPVVIAPSPRVSVEPPPPPSHYSYYCDAARAYYGVKPADLPAEQPMAFELVLNLTTAQALGLTLPPPLFFQAHEELQ